MLLWLTADSSRGVAKTAWLTEYSLAAVLWPMRDNDWQAMGVDAGLWEGQRDHKGLGDILSCNWTACVSRSVNNSEHNHGAAGLDSIAVQPGQYQSLPAVILTRLNPAGLWSIPGKSYHIFTCVSGRLHLIGEVLLPDSLCSCGFNQCDQGVMPDHLCVTWVVAEAVCPDWDISIGQQLQLIRVSIQPQGFPCPRVLKTWMKHAGVWHNIKSYRFFVCKQWCGTILVVLSQNNLGSVRVMVLAGCQVVCSVEHCLLCACWEAWVVELGYGSGCYWFPPACLCGLSNSPDADFPFFTTGVCQGSACLRGVVCHIPWLRQSGL